MIVSVPPQAYFVQQIAGPRAEITVLLPPGSTPEIAAPSPRQMVALTHADLVVLVGHPNFLFERRHVLPMLVRHPEIATVSMAAALDLAAAPADGPEQDPATTHAHEGAGDPHLWVSPALVRRAADAIAGTLARIDPAAAPVYRRRLLSFHATIDTLDADIHREVDGLENRAFLVYHPAWSRFAAEYRLDQVAIEADGQEPSLKHVVELIGEARRRGIRIAFAQPGFPSRGAAVIAREIGARVVTLDPLSADWPGTLRTLARALGSASLDRAATDPPPDETTLPGKNPSRGSFHG